MLRSSLTAFIRWVMRDVVYLGRYPCVVQLQHDDDTVDVLPDHPRFRGKGLSRVAIRHGIPGVRVRVSPSARCLLGFESGDPSKPYVALWDPGSVEQILFNGGDAGVARQGDTCTIVWPTLDALGMINGIPWAVTLTPLSPSLGIIDTASTSVLAGG